jgi:hypothetical protein
MNESYEELNKQIMIGEKLYKPLKKCYENKIIFYWGRDGGYTELKDICFSFDEDDSSWLEGFLRDIFFDYNLEVCIHPNRRKPGGVIRIDTGISEREFYKIFHAIIDDMKSDLIDASGYKYLFVRLVDIDGDELNPLRNDDVLEFLASGYAIKCTNIYKHRGVLSMGIIFERSKMTPADVLSDFGDETL